MSVVHKVYYPFTRTRLDLEPSRFNMSAEETLARRQTFWELVTFDRLLVRDTHSWLIAELTDGCSHSGPGDHQAPHPCTSIAKCPFPMPMNRRWRIDVRACPSLALLLLSVRQFFARNTRSQKSASCRYSTMSLSPRTSPLMRPVCVSARSCKNIRCPGRH